MADFGQNMQRLRPFQHFSDMDINMAVLNQFSELKPGMSENFNIPDHFSLQTPLISHQQSEFPENYTHNNLLSNFHYADSLITANTEDVFHENNQRQVTEQSTSISQNISCSASTTEFEGDTDKRRKNRFGRGKKGKSNEKEEGKAEEVVHVRAKRGQATDSHSIAERVRREKINKKMKCLQDLVPGCHKTMGMAGTLEEIINYVHSLQNQVEFLSMELAAACSSSHDSNLQTEANRKTQKHKEARQHSSGPYEISPGSSNYGTNSHEAVEMERWAREGYGDYYSCYHSTWSL